MGCSAAARCGAVKRFQHEHGLLVDGQVGPRTWSSIMAENAGTTGETDPPVRLPRRDSSPISSNASASPPTATSGRSPARRSRPSNRPTASSWTARPAPTPGRPCTRVGSWHVPASDLPRGHSSHHRHIHQPTHHHHHQGSGEAEAAVHVAERYLGVRYVYGARAPRDSTARAWCSTPTRKRRRLDPPHDLLPVRDRRAGVTRRAAARRPAVLRPRRTRRHVRRRRTLHPRPPHRHGRAVWDAQRVVSRELCGGKAGGRLTDSGSCRCSATMTSLADGGTRGRRGRTARSRGAM